MGAGSVRGRTADPGGCRRRRGRGRTGGRRTVPGTQRAVLRAFARHGERPERTPIRAGAHHRRTGHGARAGRPAAHRLRRQAARVPGRRGRRPGGTGLIPTGVGGVDGHGRTAGETGQPRVLDPAAGRLPTRIDRAHQSGRSAAGGGRGPQDPPQPHRERRGDSPGRGRRAGRVGRLGGRRRSGRIGGLGSDHTRRAAPARHPCGGAVLRSGRPSGIDRRGSVGCGVQPFPPDRYGGGRRRSGRDQRAHPRARRADPPLGADPGRRDRLA